MRYTDGVYQGDIGALSHVVRCDQTVPHLHPTLPAFQAGEPVLATGFLLGLLEEPCMAQLRRHRLSPSETVVGVAVADFRHRAPAVAGDRLCISAECTRADDPQYEFKVRAVDAVTNDIVGHAVITHHVLDVDLFRAQLTRPAAPRRPARLAETA